MKTRICVLTGTRAEYGLLRPLIRLLWRDPRVELKLLVTGTHLSPEFGYTVQEIEEKDAIEPIEILLSSDSSVGVAKSFGLAVLGISDVLRRLAPDWCLIAGDRYEALACASTCVMLSVPVAHLHGGEISLGSLDEYFRHAVTKLSRLHFTSNQEARARVIQMGENPETVHNVGAIGLDNLFDVELLSRKELEEDLNFKFGKRNLLITIHPEVNGSVGAMLSELRGFLQHLRDLADTMLIFTKANADADGRSINAVLQEFVNANPGDSVLFDSLGVSRYFSVLKQVDAVVGNSSSGIIEAPSLGIPTVNIGKRQAGRTRAASVLDCTFETVVPTLQTAMSAEFQEFSRMGNNPYGDGKSAKKVVDILLNFRITTPTKRFYDQPT